jgi:diguanylate cyclase (GGDEF)-like protein
MSLQRRLTLFFVVIVMLPLAAAALVVQRVVVGEFKNRAMGALQPAINSALAAYNAKAPFVDGLVQSSLGSPDEVGAVLSRQPAAIDGFLEERLSTAGIDYLVVLDDSGHLIASEAKPGDFADGFREPSGAEIAEATGDEGGVVGGPGFISSRPVMFRLEGQSDTYTVLGGFWVDNDFLEAASAGEVEVSVVSGGRVVASTERDPAPPPVSIEDSNDPSNVEVIGAEAARAQRIAGDMALVAWAPSDPITALGRRILLSELGLILLALIATSLLAYALARLITRPLEELSAGANAIAQGRFDFSIPVRSRDEVGRLATAFNEMTGKLRDTVTELSSSRDQLQRAVRRVGETLRSTHDMKQILEALVNTSKDAVDADAGILWGFTSTRAQLYPVMGVGTSVDSLKRVAVGSGVVGLVAERGNPILFGLERGAPRRSRSEPGFPVGILVPLYSEDRITGIIGLYRDRRKSFTQEDYETVVFLAEQGGVAVENVLLHDEAQRLSITDGLTGVWNRRYFQMQFRQVLATSLRFHRPFSVLMLDLDNFKTVNDTFGHQRGDAILIEFAQRVSRTLREVDTFARYGGEEFICLLSETDVQGGLTTAEKIRDVIGSQEFGHVGEEPIKLTVSIGLAAYPEHADSYQTLVDSADRALYRAKQEGRDRVKVAEKPSRSLKLAT